jgi:SAM-dependent methyltransferase
MLSWYTDDSQLLAVIKAHQPAMDAADAYVEALERLEGYCSVCESRTRFEVATGVMLGAHPSLREGIRCPGCGLINRNRLLFDAIRGVDPDRFSDGLILEATTPLYASLSAKWPWLQGSEYFGDGYAPGQWVDFRGLKVANRSITALGVADSSVDLVVHNDVLEHVADTALAFSECRRVLRPGGVCVFTMPFFPYRATSLLRGRVREDGSIEHIEPPEYHGDGLRSEGIYTFYHFGMDLLPLIRNCGFSRVETGIDVDVFRGYTTNNHRYGHEALMPPIVFRAWR